jgi:hypothetical protein
MTWRKREIMDMAREAGLLPCEGIHPEDLKAFDKLVREDERKALCKLMEDQNTWDFYDPNRTAIEIIRARGQA